MIWLLTKLSKQSNLKLKKNYQRFYLYKISRQLFVSSRCCIPLVIKHFQLFETYIRLGRFESENCLTFQKPTKHDK